MADLREHVLEQLDFQSRSCRWIGSPLYERLIAAAARDAAAGGPTWSVLEPYAADPEGTAMVLRFMAAVHRLVLRGEAPELARFYPSAGGRADGEGAERAFLDAVAEHEPALRADTAQPLQTNEVGRSAALAGGFLTVAETFGLHLSVLEIGASAGLNLRWDHFLYEARGATWGDPESPVRLCDFNSDAPPPFGVAATVAARRGCDPGPIDPRTEEGATLLLSFVWPDQLGRIRLLRGAIEVARRVPATVDEATAAEWLRAHGHPAPGRATVVFHSIVRQYVDDDEWAAVEGALDDAGAQATADAPFAYLRMEPDEDDMKVVEVRLTTWPGGDERLLAHSGYHGTGVRWLGAS
ncbi:MAG TPA: DUF2332 domain-containing protein [Actinomycetota bacterium]|nr:DUF2332 domain-containing protein [Actinomycetota bacterium]